jgi:cyclohexanecarboxylate-CoA ligase
VTDQLGEFRAPDALVERYHAAGLWRSEGPIADLRRWRRERPDATAIIHYRDGVQGRITWESYAASVERFAGALRELGVGPGDAVAVWLPNVWQVSALMLACARLGAVNVPLLPTLRSRELSRILARVEPKVCVTIDSWAGFDHAAALELLAPPSMHRVVLRDGSLFSHSSARVDLDSALEDPDRLALVFFTSGTTGEPKGVLHSFNTIYAGIRPIASAENIGPDDTMFIPHALTFIGGTLYGITMPLLAGATSVILDRWSGEAGLRLLRETGTTVMFAAPTFLHDILAQSPGPLPSLRLLVTGATTVPQQLVRTMPASLGLPLRTLWGMTEVAAQTWTRADDPEDWGASSDGSPGSGLSIDLRSSSGGPVTAEQPARLFVRGAGVTLATLGRDSGTLNVLASHDDGWYDTGDHAIPDGRGGIRIIGRVGDRIGGLFMIPVNDVESQLLEHPAIDDVAVVGFGDDQACAVIVSAAPPSLSDLQAFLTAAGMTDWYQPVRVEVVDKLPRNSAGKVRKDLLRRWLKDGTWGDD